MIGSSMNVLGRIQLDLVGLGIIIYSPAGVAHIREGENYFSTRFNDGPGVQSHLQAGTIAGFGTGTPGTFLLEVRTGYPDDGTLAAYPMHLRLAVRVGGGRLCFRDLFDLTEWTSGCPAEQTVEMADGIHHITLCSRVPPSGVLGDEQEILAYLAPLEAWPELARSGIPTLGP